jgi:hypothetical protein
LGHESRTIEATIQTSRDTRSLGAGIAAALIIVLAMPVISAAAAAERATTPELMTRALTCDEDMGAGTGPDPAGTLTIGPVELLGVTVTPLTLTRLTDGVLWFKSYIVIPNSREARVVMSVRSLSGGKVGLDWGTQSISGNAKHPQYTPLNSLKATTLSMPLCNGSSAGFPGGFVMTKPLCAQIMVSAGKAKRSGLLSFGGASCPADQM